MKRARQFVPGIDISYWNVHDLTSDLIGAMLATAQEHGVEWLMFRAGKGGAESGLDLSGMDKKLADVTMAAGTLGIPCLSYWRCYDILDSDPVEQAHAAFDAFEYAAVHATGVRVPMILDIEELWPSTKGVLPDSVVDVNRYWLSEFRTTLGRLGMTYVGVYTRKSWWDPVVTLPWGDTPLFTSHWIRETVPSDAETWENWAFLKMKDGPAIPSAWSSADVWQFAAVGGGFGSVIGASSVDIDCNLMSTSLCDRIFT